MQHTPGSDPQWQPQSSPPDNAYPPPGHGQPPTRKGVGGLSVALAALLVLSACVSALLSVALFARRSLMGDTLDGAAGNPNAALVLDDVMAADSFFFIAAGLGVVNLLVIPVWIIWQYRYAHNAALLRGPFRPDKGWAIGGWFIPLVCYVVPQLQLMNSARASERSPRVVPIVAAWWATYVAFQLINGSSFVVRLQDYEIYDEQSLRAYVSRFQFADALFGVGSLIQTVSAVLAVVMVRQLTTRQARNLSHIGVM